MWRVLAKTAVRVSFSRKNSYGFQPWGNTKNACLTHTCFQARRWWELETQFRPLAILVFSWGYTCASPCFCWNTSRMSRFLRTTCIDVEIHLEHIRVYNHFLCLCAETHIYLLVLEVWNLETHACFLVFFSKKQEAHARSTPACSHLLLNNRKRQDLKSCSVPSVLSHFSCSHSSREIVLHLSKKNVLPYKTSVARPKNGYLCQLCIF